jgi:pimeloyl-ACP methyl ester carboxylesterase
MPKLTALVVSLVLAAVLAPAAQARHHGAPPPKPTVVLVHGAWADGSSWSKVARRLQRDGYPVKVAANPLRGLASDAAYLAAVLKTIPGPVVLAGHSYGGAVITNAALGLGNVKALVYVDAFIPDQGQSVLQLVASRPGSALGGDPATVFDAVPYPGAPPGDVDLYVKPNVFVGAFGNDLRPAKAAVLAASQRPLTFSAAAEPSGPPAWKTIPSWAVVGTIDRTIPPAAQLDMARHAGARITQIRAGHLSMLSQPDAVQSVIERAARSLH